MSAEIWHNWIRNHITVITIVLFLKIKSLDIRWKRTHKMHKFHYETKKLQEQQKHITAQRNMLRAFLNVKCIIIRNVYLQLSISIWHSCRSIGKYSKFIGHDAVIVNLIQQQKQRRNHTMNIKQNINKWNLILALMESA